MYVVLLQVMSGVRQQHSPATRGRGAGGGRYSPTPGWGLRLSRARSASSGAGWAGHNHHGWRYPRTSGRTQSDLDGETERERVPGCSAQQGRFGAAGAFCRAAPAPYPSGFPPSCHGFTRASSRAQHGFTPSHPPVLWNGSSLSTLGLSPRPAPAGSPAGSPAGNG